MYFKIIYDNDNQLLDIKPYFNSIKKPRKK